MSRFSYWYWPVLAFLVLTVALFSEYLFGGKILYTSDPTLLFSTVLDRSLWETWTANWRDQGLGGMPGPQYARLVEPLAYLMGGRLFNNLVWPLLASVSSLGLMWYLRLRQVPWQGALVGCLTAFWLGTSFTILHAGHVMKFFTLALFTWAVPLAYCAAKTGTWTYSVLAGAAAGFMFAHQPDLAILFCGVWAMFFGYRLLTERQRRWKQVLAYAGAAFFLMSAAAVWGNYRHNVRDAVVSTTADAEKWEYATRWSFPPAELHTLVVPGALGWYTGHGTHPYTGRVGREGLAGNFMAEGVYLGFFPLLLAVVAVARAAWWGSRQGGGLDLEVLFWLVIAAGALLLSFGKYAEFYGLFYQLPLMDSMRNPNKFLHVFQLAIGILAAYGVTTVLGLDKQQKGSGT